MTTNIPRRTFLRRTAAVAGAGLAMPYIIPSGVLSQQPNEQIGIAGIGVGRRGAQVISGLKNHKESRFVAFADVDLNRAKAHADKYGGEAYQDYRKLLERDDVDAVVSATVDHWRALTCIHACQAGKDIYAEKPMTLTIREGRLMVEAVRKYGRVFQTGSQQRSMAQNRKGCELIRNGKLGKLEKILASNFPSPWEVDFPGQPVPQGLDWDMWCGPTEPVPYHQDLFIPRANPGWISFRTYSGGEMTGWGAHGFDQVQWALGMDESGPVEVWTEGGPFDPPTYTEPTGRGPGEGACNKPKVFMKYPGDVVMELGGGPGGGAVFIGEKGKLTIDRGKCVSDPPEIAQEELTDDDIRLYESASHTGNWLECIKSRQKPVCDVEVGHRSGTVCHLGNIARWTGRKLTWDPVKEHFVGDKQANALLDRPRRTGYRLPTP